MGLLRNLEIMLGGIVTRKVDSALYNWIEALSLLLDGEPGSGSNLVFGATNQGLTQTTWFVDPVNGNDANDGSTLALALKTDARRQVLWGGSGCTIIRQPTTLTYVSTPPASDVVNFYVAYTNGGSLTIKGTPTVTTPAVTLTAVTTLNRATQTPWDVTGVGLSAADVGRMMRITAGARINNYASVAKDLTGGRLRVTPFGNIDVPGAVTTGVCFAQVTPQVTDVVEVFTVPVLTIGSCIFRAMADVVPTLTTNCIVFDTIGLDGNSSGAISMLGTIVLQGAFVFFRQSTWARIKFGGNGGLYGAGGIANGVWQVQAGFSNNGGPFSQFYSFLSTGIFTNQVGASTMLGGDCLFQNAGCQTAGNLYSEFVSVFDRSVANIAVQVFTGGYLRSRPIAGGDLLWGDGNAGVGVKVLSGGALTYVTKPTINTPQGAGRQSLIGGVNVDWAGVPVVTAANNAMIVVEA